MVPLQASITNFVLIFDLLTTKVDRFMSVPHGPPVPICTEIS